MSPLFMPVNTTSPEDDTLSERFVTLLVKSIAEAVSTVLFDPAAPRA